MAVSGLVLIGGVVLMIVGGSDRNSARNDRTVAQHSLEVQRSATDAAQAMVRQLNDAVSKYGQDATIVLKSEQTLGSLDDQIVTNDGQLRDAGKAGSIDDYNRISNAGNALSNQRNALLPQINSQLNTLTNEINTLH